MTRRVSFTTLLRSQPQNAVLYIPARGWFRELHKCCVEARGQHAASHTLADPARVSRRVHVVRTGVRQVRARGHAANAHCHAARIVRACRCTLRLHAFHAPCSLSLSQAARANEIPRARAHTLTFRGPRRLSAAELRLSRREQYLGKYRCCSRARVAQHARLEFERVESRDEPAHFFYARGRLKKVATNGDRRRESALGNRAFARKSLIRNDVVPATQVDIPVRISAAIFLTRLVMSGCPESSCGFQARERKLCLDITQKDGA